MVPLTINSSTAKKNRKVNWDQDCCGLASPPKTLIIGPSDPWYLVGIWSVPYLQQTNQARKTAEMLW